MHLAIAKYRWKMDGRSCLNPVQDPQFAQGLDHFVHIEPSIVVIVHAPGAMVHEIQRPGMLHKRSKAGLVARLRYLNTSAAFAALPPPERLPAVSGLLIAPDASAKTYTQVQTDFRLQLLLQTNLQTVKAIPFTLLLLGVEWLV